MEKKSKKYIGALLFVLLACIFLMACRTRDSKEEEETSSEITEDSAVDFEDEVKQFEAEEEEPLVVFYSGSHLSAPVVLSNFEIMHPEINLKSYSIKGSDLESIQETLDEYGEPDIWLLDGNSGISYALDNLYEQGLIADLRTFVTEDESLDPLDYVGGTFTAMDNGEALFGLPLTWKKDCLIIRDPKWQDSELAYLPENYTGEELYKAFITEFEKERPNNGIFWADYTFGLMSNLYELGLVKEEDGETVIDEELFTMVFDFTLRQEKQNQEIKNLYPRNTGSATGDPDLFQGTPALDPAMYDSNYVGCSLSGAPQVTAVYAKSVIELHGEDIHMYYMPTYNSSDEYVADVADYAMVGGNSARKQQAYDVIRMMMDTPMEIVNQPAGRMSSGETYSPVNIELALELMDYFGSMEIDLPIYDATSNLFYTLNKGQLTAEEKQQIKDLINGISDLSYWYGDRPEEAAFYFYYDDYMHNSGELKPKFCYLEMMQAWNPDSEKWNMTPAEVEAFLNE